MNPPKAFLALGRALRATLWFVLFTCLAPISLHAEWISLRIIAPITYVGEPVNDESRWIGDFYADNGYAIITGYSVDPGIEGSSVLLSTTSIAR
jgi:hypothetical protein